MHRPNGKRSDLTFAECLELEATGAWAEAADAYRELSMSLDPATRCRALVRLARCLLETCKRGETDEADDILAEAAQLAAPLGSPDLDGQLQLQQGRLDEQQGHLKRALERYNAAFQLLTRAGSDLTEAQLVLASAERRRGELCHALARLDAIDPTTLVPRLQAEYFDERGAVLIARGEARQAVEVLERALELDAQTATDYASGRSRLLLAEASMLVGQRDRAKVLIEDAIRVYDRARAEAGLSDAYALMGMWYEEAEDYVSASHYYHESYDLDRTSDDRAGQARAKRRLGRTYRKRGDSVRARELFADARRLMPREDDVEAAALCREEGELALSGSEPDYAKAISLFRRAVAIAEDDGDERVTAVARRDLARALREDDDLTEAERLLREAEATLRVRGDLRELDDLLDDLGEVLLEGARYQEAEACLLESLELDERLGRVASKGRTLLLLGRVSGEMGERERAGQYFRSAVELFSNADDHVGLSDALQQLGAWHLTQGQVEDAIECCQAALEIDNRLNDPIGRARTKRLLAAARRVSGNLERAAEHLGEAKRDLGTIDDPVEHAFIDLEGGRLALATGMYREAMALLSSAREVLEANRRPVDVASCDRFIALAIAHTGNFADAIKLLEGAKEVFQKANDLPELDELFDDLGTVYLLSGRLDLAEHYVRKSFDVGNRLRWAHGKGRSLLLLARIAMGHERVEEAKRFIDDARAAYVSTKDDVGLADAHVELGDWYIADSNPQPNPALAVEEYKHARRIEQVHRDRRGIARCNRKLAHVYIDRGDHERAGEALEEAEVSLRGIDDDREIAPLDAETGRLYAAKNNHVRAVGFFRKAIAGFAALNDEAGRRSTYRMLIASYQAMGETTTALECVREMDTHQSTMFNVLLADLHPMVVQASRASYADGRYSETISSAFGKLERTFKRRTGDPAATSGGMRTNISKLIRDWGATGPAELLGMSENRAKSFVEFSVAAFDLFRNRAVHEDADFGPTEAFAALAVAHIIASTLVPVSADANGADSTRSQIDLGSSDVVVALPLARAEAQTSNL
jgi:tetratricopeptide (TPR) repeat protein